MATKQPAMQFFCLWQNYDGLQYGAVDYGAHFQLENHTNVLSGARGQPFKFKSADSARFWIEAMMLQTAIKGVTKPVALGRLQAAQIKEPRAWLAAEIAIIQARNAGVWFELSDLMIDGGNALT
jgi:hypothetical protein